MEGVRRMGNGRAGRLSIPAYNALLRSRGILLQEGKRQSFAQENVSASLIAQAKWRSKWEAAYANHLELQLKAKVIRSYRYEGLTLRLAKRKYHRTDFVIGHLDGTVELAQVKGWHKNLRAGIAGLKWAAQLYPMFAWTMKRWTGTGWDSNYVDI